MMTWGTTFITGTFDLIPGGNVDRSWLECLVLISTWSTWLKYTILTFKRTRGTSTVWTSRINIFQS